MRWEFLAARRAGDLYQVELAEVGALGERGPASSFMARRLGPVLIADGASVDKVNIHALVPVCGVQPASAPAEDFQPSLVVCPGARLSECVVHVQPASLPLPGYLQGKLESGPTIIGPDSRVSRSTLYPGSQTGKWARLDRVVLGYGAVVGDDASVIEQQLAHTPPEDRACPIHLEALARVGDGACIAVSPYAERARVGFAARVEQGATISVAANGVLDLGAESTVDSKTQLISPDQRYPIRVEAGQSVPPNKRYPQGVVLEASTGRERFPSVLANLSRMIGERLGRGGARQIQRSADETLP